MKTSFYFVLWIIIYPILGLLNNSFINQNSFIIALVIVWGLSWSLNKILPQTLTYERASQIAPLLEEIYTGDVADFKKRVTRDMWIESITSVYFIATTIVIAFAIFTAGVNDWIALAVFILFSLGAITRSFKLIKSKLQLKANPTVEQCAEIVDETYKMDYASYYESHIGLTYQEMLPEKPRHFKLFQIFSNIIAVIAFCLGLIFIIRASVLIINYQYSAEGQAVGIMLFLYGSLAAYFGIKDFFSSFHKKKNLQQTV